MSARFGKSRERLSVYRPTCLSTLLAMQATLPEVRAWLQFIGVSILHCGISVVGIVSSHFSQVVADTQQY